MKIINGVATVNWISKIKANTVISDAGLKGKTFPFDMGKPTFRKRNRWYYFVDVDKGQITLQGGQDPAMAPQLLHAIIKKEIGKQLVSRLETVPFSAQLLVVIICISLGLAAGYILGNVLPMTPTP